MTRTPSVLAESSRRTSSEVASVLEASTPTASLSGSTTANKLVLASSAATAQPAASFWGGASLVGFLLGGQRSLALLLVLFQQLGRLLFLQLSIDDLIEALPLLRQGVETYTEREKHVMQEEAEKDLTQRDGGDVSVSQASSQTSFYLSSSGQRVRAPLYHHSQPSAGLSACSPRQRGRPPQLYAGSLQTGTSSSSGRGQTGWSGGEGKKKAGLG